MGARMGAVESARIDRYLWAVRLCSTRSEATATCRAGHVRLNGRDVKAATPVAVGDRIEARLHGRDRVVEVARVIDKRVGAPLAADCYVDHSPPPPPRDNADITAERERGAGRPTKRDRRRLDRFRGSGA